MLINNVTCDALHVIVAKYISERCTSCRNELVDLEKVGYKVLGTIFNEFSFFLFWVSYRKRLGDIFVLRRWKHHKGESQDMKEKKLLCIYFIIFL